MKKFLSLCFFVALVGVISTTEAQEQSSVDSPLPQSEVIDQITWTTTKPDPATKGVIGFSATEVNLNENFIEVVTANTISASRTRPPASAGVVTFKAKHNKAGLFYVYGQTSDNGGQLLFSIQLTEDRGILLEESDRQITLLPDYTAEQWYNFSISFDNSKGARGTFAVTIDGVPYGEYEYVQSESDTFDFSQITIGGESTGKTSVSGFTDPFSSAAPVVDTATSDALLLLSISLSSTSISSDLDNGLIVTASLDGIASIATSSLYASTNTPTTSETVATTSTESDSSLGSFIMDIVDTVIDIFTPDDESATSTEATLPDEATTEPEGETLPQPEPVSEPVISTEPTPESTDTPVAVAPEEITPEEVTAPEPEVITEDTTNNETITSEF